MFEFVIFCTQLLTEERRETLKRLQIVCIASSSSLSSAEYCLHFEQTLNKKQINFCFQNSENQSKTKPGANVINQIIVLYLYFHLDFTNIESHILIRRASTRMYLRSAQILIPVLILLQLQELYLHQLVCNNWEVVGEGNPVRQQVQVLQQPVSALPTYICLSINPHELKCYLPILNILGIL